MSNTIFTYIDNSTSSSSNATLTNSSYNPTPALKSVAVGTICTHIGMNCFLNVTSLLSITFSNTVLTLGDFAFQGCTGLTSVVIPNSVTFLGNGCFAQCSGLTSMILGNSIITIDQNCFDSCSSLTSIIIPDSVVNIGVQCFIFCTALTSVILGNSVSFLAQQAFEFCSALTTLTFKNQNALTFAGVIIFIGTPAMTVTYKNTPNQAALNAVSLNLQSQFTEGTIFIYEEASCFLDGTLILSYVDDKEQYIRIEELSKGMLVKTFKHGYKPIFGIIKTQFYNCKNKEYQLYECSNIHYPEVFQNLYITGNHSILVDKVTEKQREECIKSMGRFFVTDGKGRLMAHLDERAVPYNIKGVCNIYHIALEHENNTKNYGIYANGLLVETTSKRNFLSSI